MTAQEFITKFPDTQANNNCLEDIACPECGYRDCFIIQATSAFIMHDSGTSDFGPVDYDDNNYIACDSCGHDGNVSKFTIKGLDELLNEVRDN